MYIEVTEVNLLHNTFPDSIVTAPLRVLGLGIIRIINSEIWLPVTCNRQKEWGINTSLLAGNNLFPVSQLLVRAPTAIFENVICDSFCTS
jgi:hypothetical protein